MNLITKLFLITLIIAAFVMSLLSFMSNEKTLYVDALKVFEEFELTQELREVTDDKSKFYDSRLDSLKLSITLLNSDEQEKYQRLVFQYQELERAKTNDVGQAISEADENIWRKLNDYFQEYGKEKQCAVLLGGMANGTVLFVNSRKDVTGEFVEFANSKYNGE